MKPGSITVIGAIPRGTDPDSGAEIKQLTSAPAIHEDIYGEVPYMDASSRWLMYITGVRPYPHYPGEIWRADLQKKLAYACLRECARHPWDCHQP